MADAMPTTSQGGRGILQKNNQWNASMVCHSCQMDTVRFLTLLQCCHNAV